MQHAIRIPNGILHYSSTDAVFKRLNGSKIRMEFHHYCGPSFFDDEEFLYVDDSPEWDYVWEQFEGWWEAKGKALYGNKK